MQTVLPDKPKILLSKRSNPKCRLPCQTIQNANCVDSNPKSTRTMLTMLTMLTMVCFAITTQH